MWVLLDRDYVRCDFRENRIVGTGLKSTRNFSHRDVVCCKQIKRTRLIKSSTLGVIGLGGPTTTGGRRAHRRMTSTPRTDRRAPRSRAPAERAEIRRKRASGGRLRSNRKWKYIGDPLVRLLDPHFLFAPLYITGSISHRYGATHAKTLTLRHCKLRGTWEISRCPSDPQ